MKHHTLSRGSLPRLAYIYTESRQDVQCPPVLFLGGYRSDMTGTKATVFETLAVARGQAYARFDYSGHGLSDGVFVDGTIGQWAQDALAILEHVVQRPALLVGSSMGGWIALLVAQARPDLVHGIIGIAAAPDFTEHIYDALSSQQKETLLQVGVLQVENDYSDEPYIYTREFYKEAKAHLRLTRPCPIAFPLHLIQGKQDLDVPWQMAVRIAEIYQGPDTQIIFIEDGGHRLSRPQDLDIIDRHIRQLSGF